MLIEKDRLCVAQPPPTGQRLASQDARLLTSYRKSAGFCSGQLRATRQM